ncbi:hypothetical protein [Saccharothrix hoggarensis]|uniref:Uncharacterized protein n=1 Tax=Saccharothrix hoggarensis TaxID=913853 RepID=A0ABW3QYI1_9PSEU
MSAVAGAVVDVAGSVVGAAGSVVGVVRASGVRCCPDVRRRAFP